MNVTVDFTKCWIQEITPKVIRISGSKPRPNLKNYGTDMVILPLSQVEIVSHKGNDKGYPEELHIKVPEWLFRDRFDKGDKEDIVKSIKFINLEE